MKIDSAVKFGISKKADGQMILRYGEVAKENRRKFFSKEGVDIANVVATKLVHGNQVWAVDQKDAGKTIENIDGLITNIKNICLTVTISDCLPLYFYDLNKKIIGIAHAGWRGVVKNIAANVAKAMHDEHGSEYKNIKAYVGPHIKKCHFEIKKDILSEFKEYPDAIIREGNKISVSLESIIKEQLLDVGLIDKNIDITPDCTYCNQEYFSFRRDKPDDVQSQVAYICLI